MWIAPSTLQEFCGENIIQEAKIFPHTNEFTNILLVKGNDSPVSNCTTFAMFYYRTHE